MSFQTREQALQSLQNVTVRELQHRHIVALGYILAMTFDITDTPATMWRELSMSDNITLGPKDITILENTAHLLFEYTTLSTTEVDDLKKIAKDFFRWRLAVASGAVCDRVSIYGDLVGTTEIIARLNDYIDPMTLNGVTQLINSDEDFINALINLVRSEAKIVDGVGE